MAVKETIINVDEIKQEFFVRAKLNEDHALYLAEIVESGGKFPPIEVSYNDKEEIILVDGRHRLYAYSTILEKKSIPAIFVAGSREELLLRAMRANTGGSLSTGAQDINVVIKQLVCIGVAKTKIIQQMSQPHFPFTASLIRKHLEDVITQMTRDKLAAAQQAVVEGMSALKAAEKFEVPLARLQKMLGGSSKKKAQIHEIMGNLTRVSHSRSRMISHAIDKIFDLFEDGELRANQVQMVLDQIEGLNKRAVKLHQNWVLRFEERKKSIKAIRAA